jgi:hypothetical protein
MLWMSIGGEKMLLRNSAVLSGNKASNLNQRGCWGVPSYPVLLERGSFRSR